MKKTAKRFFSMLLVLAMVLSMAPMTVLAAPHDHAAHTQQAAKPGNTEDKTPVELSPSVSMPLLLNTEGVKVDETDPAIITLTAELNDIKVLNAEGESVPLTEEQIQTILAMYQQYLDHWADNANILGVQTPFFLSYNDNEDSLGILGEMLVMANIPLAAVRAGQVSYDDITGMIQNFMYGDALGVQFYGNAIKSARNEVLDLIESSGAMTDEQKYMVINNWLAQNVVFDMEYIMNTDKEEDEKPMVAADPQEHEYYDTVYDIIYADYEEALDQQFRQQIRDGLKAEFKHQFYVGAIENGYYQSVYAEVEAQVKDSIYQEAYNAVYQDEYDKAYAEYMEEHAHVHSYTEAVTTEPTCGAAGVKTFTCECGDTYTEGIPATGEHVDADNNALCDVCGNAVDHTHAYTASVTTEATCGADGVKTYTCPCGDTYTEAIPATGEHTYESKVTTEPTCTAEGVMTYTCVCGDTYTAPIAVVDHQFVDGVCTACGKEEETASCEHEYDMSRTDGACTKCGVVHQDHIDQVADGYCDVCYIDLAAAAALKHTSGTVAEDGETEETIESQADAYAKEQAHAAADAAANAAVEAEAETIAAQADSVATSETEKFMNENADAINADPVAFVENVFGADAAAQIAAQWEDFWADAEQNGVDIDGSGNKVPIDAIVEQQMDTPMDDLGGMTPNEAIPVYAAQAAAGLTDGVLNYWQGHHFGALGRGFAVCLGYTKAFTYLVQCLQSDIYTTGNIDNASSWKTAEELYYTNGELDITKNYAVDSVRITFDADVTMYGETQENFNSDHFWNAVKVDGKWFYVDPCYTDVYTEVMMRDRVETDGSMNYMYFLFSHGTTTSLYDGYYSEIKTLYADAATYTDYEDSWISRVKSNIYPNGGYFYYAYDSTDLISLMEESNNNSDMTADDVEESLYKIVRHKLDTSDAGTNGDSDYETLVELNYKENEDDDESVARYLDAEGNMVESELLTALYAQHEEDRQNYPSLGLSCVFHNNKVYFHLSNCILYYDLSTAEVVLAKEYNTVHGLRDDTNPFGGMAFSVVDSADEADFTVENHPIAAISLKDDGNLYVSIATNFAFISGKDPHNSADQGSYGYEFEESNYNASYNSYTNDKINDNDMAATMGYEAEENDNDEFMWSANFVETMSMSHFGGTNHSYEEVTVEATCGRNAYTENRCTTCGASEAETRVEVADTAHEHHYIRFEETYYTKADNGNWNAGFCYICTECLNAVVEPTEPDPDADYESNGTTYEEQLAIYEEEKAIYDAAVASAGHTYAPTDATWTADSTSVSFKNLACDNGCVEREAYLDCLIDNDKSGNDSIKVTLSNTATAEATVAGYTGDCTEGAVAIYTATGEAEGYAFTATNELTLEPGQHAYEAEFTWAEVQDDEGNPTGEYTAIADVVCGICGDAHEDVVADVVFDEENSTESTCTVAGQDIYVATVTITNDAGTVIGTVSRNKVIDLPLLPHDYVDGFCSVCGGAQMTVPTIVSCYSKLQDSVKVTWTTSEGADGYELFRTTTPDDADSWAKAKTINDGATDRYTNQGLEIGTTYYYKVRAFALDADGNKTYTDFSDVDYMPAAVVFDGPYSNATFRIRLRWHEVGGSHGYQIWRQNEDGSWAIAKTLGDRGSELTDNQGATTAYSNTGLTAGETYNYKMRAFMITEDGRKIFGAYSDEYAVAVMPETPVVTGTSPKATRAQLTWDAINGAAGYQVWMAESENGEYKIAKSVTDGSTSCTAYELTSGKTYYFKVRAYTDVEGKKTFGAYSEIISVTVK